MSRQPSAIVLLPGLDGTSVLFQPLVERLPPEMAPITVDYSQTCPAGYADHLPTVLAALPAGRDYVLLGWSFSGPLALQAASTQPPGLRGIVLCASFVRKPVSYVPAFMRHVAMPGLFRCAPLFVRLKARLSGYSTPGLQRLLELAHARLPAAVMAQRVRALLTVNVEAELQRCPVPVLYLAGSRDRVVPRGNWRAIQRLRPDVTVATIEGGHLALATNPDEGARVLAEFAASLRVS